MRKTILMLLALASFSNFEANALTLDQARSQGVVCEGTNGLLVPVGISSPDVQQLISTINAQRNQEYQKIQANQPNSTLGQVMSIAAQEIMSSVPQGTYIMDANGNCSPK